MTLRLAVTFPIEEGNLLSSSIAETDHPTWNAGTTYAEEDKVMLSHVRYEALQASTGKSPLADDAQNFWLPLGATNRWRAFDRFIGDPVLGEAGEEMVYQLGQIGQPVSVVSCFGVSAAEISLVVRVSGGRIVYEQTLSLRDNSFVIDGWTYAFEPIRTRSEAVFSNIPPYAQATYELTISGGGEAPKLGQIVMGREYDIGEVQFGSDFGIDDYSVVNRNDFGALSIIPRPFSKVVAYRAIIPAEQGRRVAIVLEENRAQPVVVFGGPDSDVMGVTVYGKLGDWRIRTVDPIDSDLELTVEGFA